VPVSPLFATPVPTNSAIPISDGSGDPNASLDDWVSDGSGGLGTVTDVSVVTANGFAGSVATSTTTPAITLSTSVSGILFGDGVGVAAAIAANFPTLNQNTTGSAATLTTPRSIFGASFNGSADLAGPVGVAFGGTGLATLTANNVILGNGTSTPLFVAPGTSGNVLTSNGTTWTSAAPGGGGTPGGSTTQLQYNNAGAFGGVTGATFSAGVLTLPNLTVSNSSGGTDLIIAAISAQASVLSFRGASSTVSYMGSAGAAGQIIGDSTVNDFNVFNNGFRMRFCTAVGAATTGFSLEGANAGISWAGSTSSTVPVKSSLTVFPASGNCALILQAAASTTAFVSFRANNNGYAACTLGQSAATNQILSGSAAGDICLALNGSGLRFLIGTASGGGQPIGFGVAAANGGIFTSAPAGGTAANWKLGIAASVSPTAPNRTIQLDVGGTLYYLHAKTTND
jgi:hypothetical protein